MNRSRKKSGKRRRSGKIIEHDATFLYRLSKEPPVPVMRDETTMLLMEIMALEEMKNPC